jgi:hypothetical protein
MAADFDADRLLIHLDRAEETQALEPAAIDAFRELVGRERARREMLDVLALADPARVIGRVVTLYGFPLRVVSYRAWPRHESHSTDVEMGLVHEWADQPAR